MRVRRCPAVDCSVHLTQPVRGKGWLCQRLLGKEYFMIFALLFVCSFAQVHKIEVLVSYRDENAEDSILFHLCASFFTPLFIFGTGAQDRGAGVVPGRGRREQQHCGKQLTGGYNVDSSIAEECSIAKMR